ncbi:MAG TPA: PIN domain-containing protein [Spirochaetales bacterium]|nr:PIN domain-containing protein [Spirochaetales bacterium]
MIVLDTNYLIRTLVAGSDEAASVRAWVLAGRELCTSAVAWYEFLCGPVDQLGLELIRSLINDRVVPFTQAQGLEAARLFNAVGRARTLRVDAMLASCAITLGASFATGNIEHFLAFKPFGLRLISGPDRRAVPPSIR